MRRIATTASLLLVFGLGGQTGVAQATHGPNVFSGRWKTNIGPVKFQVIGSSTGAQSLRSLGGHACSAPTVYYHGDYRDSGGTGKITACTKSRGHLVGRYLADPTHHPQGGGGVDIVFNPPKRFSGSYTADDYPGMSFTYSAQFVAHFPGDGCCPKRRHGRKKRRWVVDYVVREDTVFAPGALGSSTTGAGRVTFKKEPKPGRLSSGAASGSFEYTQEYQAPGNTDPSKVGEFDLSVAPLTGSYRQTGGVTKLVLQGVVDKLTKRGDTPAIQAGDSVSILLLYDADQTPGSVGFRREMSISIRSFARSRLLYSNDFPDGPVHKLGISSPRAS